METAKQVIQHLQTLVVVEAEGTPTSNGLRMAFPTLPWGRAFDEIVNGLAQKLQLHWNSDAIPRILTINAKDFDEGVSPATYIRGPSILILLKSDSCTPITVQSDNHVCIIDRYGSWSPSVHVQGQVILVSLQGASYYQKLDAKAGVHVLFAQPGWNCEAFEKALVPSPIPYKSHRIANRREHDNTRAIGTESESESESETDSESEMEPDNKIPDTNAIRDQKKKEDRDEKEEDEDEEDEEEDEEENDTVSECTIPVQAAFCLFLMTAILFFSGNHSIMGHARPRWFLDNPTASLVCKGICATLLVCAYILLSIGQTTNDVTEANKGGDDGWSGFWSTPCPIRLNSLRAEARMWTFFLVLFLSIPMVHLLLSAAVYIYDEETSHSYVWFAHPVAGQVLSVLLSSHMAVALAAIRTRNPRSNIWHLREAFVVWGVIMFLDAPGPFGWQFELPVLVAVASYTMALNVFGFTSKGETESSSITPRPECLEEEKKEQKKTQLVSTSSSLSTQAEGREKEVVSPQPATPHSAIQQRDQIQKENKADEKEVLLPQQTPQQKPDQKDKEDNADSIEKERFAHRSVAVSNFVGLE